MSSTFYSEIELTGSAWAGIISKGKEEK